MHTSWTRGEGKIQPGSKGTYIIKKIVKSKGFRGDGNCETEIVIL